MNTISIKKTLVLILTTICALHSTLLTVFALYSDENLLRTGWIDNARNISSSNLAEIRDRAASGDINSLMILTYGLLGDSPLPENPAQALEYSIMAAEQGNAFAQALISYISNKYPTTRVSKEYAFEMALKSSIQGNSIGSINAGSAYMFGVGVDQNLESAFKLLEQARKYGHPDAISRLCTLSDISDEKKNVTILFKLLEHQQLWNYECGPNIPLAGKQPKINSNKDDVVTPDNNAKEVAVSVSAAPLHEKSKTEEKSGQNRLANINGELEQTAASASSHETGQREQEHLVALKQAEKERDLAEKTEQDRLAKIKHHVGQLATAKQDSKQLKVVKLQHKNKTVKGDDVKRNASPNNDVQNSDNLAGSPLLSLPETPVERTLRDSKAISDIGGTVNNKNDKKVTAEAKKYFKYVDRNGIIFWLDDKSKIPPPMPEYFNYVDDNGIIFWVDDVSKVPNQYRINASQGKNRSDKPEHKAEGKLQHVTKINILNDKIIVPVVFKNNGHIVKAKMALDDRTPVTTLSPDLAAKLKFKKSKKTSLKNHNVDNNNHAKSTKVDSIELDGKIQANSEVLITPLTATRGVDGLLGNSFLRLFNFTIDYENQLLKWN